MDGSRAPDSWGKDRRAAEHLGEANKRPNADDSTASTTATSIEGGPQQRNEELLVGACLNNFVQLQLQWQVIWRRKLSQTIDDQKACT